MKFLKILKSPFKRKNTKIEEIKVFLSEVKNLSLGFGELNFIKLENLDEEQIGYKIDTNGNSLVTEGSGSWENDWIVIGHDNLGDPIFIESYEKNLPVYTSEHGKEEWEVVMIAESLPKFKIILQDLRTLSLGRENPVGFEENPLKEKEIKSFTKKIKKENKEVDIWWWELFLDNNIDE